MQVSDQALLVALERRPVAARVVAPRGEKTSGNLGVRVPNDFADEGELPFAIWFCNEGIPQKRIRTESLVMWSSITCVHVMPSILRILR